MAARAIRLARHGRGRRHGPPAVTCLETILKVVLAGSYRPYVRTMAALSEGPGRQPAARSSAGLQPQVPGGAGLPAAPRHPRQRLRVSNVWVSTCARSAADKAARRPFCGAPPQASSAWSVVDQVTPHWGGLAGGVVRRPSRRCRRGDSAHASIAVAAGIRILACMSAGWHLPPACRMRARCATRRGRGLFHDMLALV